MSFESFCDAPLQKQAPESKSRVKTSPKSKKLSNVALNTSACKYDIVRECGKQFGLKLVDDDEPWSIYWIDTGVSVERVLEMEPYQKINHFPGMHEICRKDHLARNISRMCRMLPKDYSFFPKTFVLPNEWSDLSHVLGRKSRQKISTFIAKPDAGCQGKGIFLFRNSPNGIKSINQFKQTNVIVQNYLQKPCLIDGFKFDLRVYALVTSADPLRIFVHRDGLARFATERYQEPNDSNISNTCMKSKNFDFSLGEGKGSKRTIESVFRVLQNRGSIQNPEILWRRIHDVIVKTLMVVQPQLSMALKACFPNAYLSKIQKDGKFSRIYTSSAGSQCFEILGFDIFLDSKLKPWLLEVNHSPSFTCDSSLDHEVKKKVIMDSLGLLNLGGSNPKKYEKAEKEKRISRLLGKYQKKERKTFTNSSSKKRDLDSFSMKNDFESTNENSTEKMDQNIEKLSDEDSQTDETFSRTSSRPLTAVQKDLIAEYYNSYPDGLLQSLKKKEDKNLGSFDRVFPPPKEDTSRFAKYLKCLSAISQSTQDTLNTKGRQVHLQRKKAELAQEIQRREKWKERVKNGVFGEMGNSIKSRLMNWRDREKRYEVEIDKLEASISQSQKVAISLNVESMNDRFLQSFASSGNIRGVYGKHAMFTNVEGLPKSASLHTRLSNTTRPKVKLHSQIWDSNVRLSENSKFYKTLEQIKNPNMAEGGDMSRMEYVSPKGVVIRIGGKGRPSQGIPRPKSGLKSGG